jgi:hypothetical protein
MACYTTMPKTKTVLLGTTKIKHEMNEIYNIYSDFPKYKYHVKTGNRI